MFNTSVTESDVFIMDLSQTAQVLYLHLGMQCDDDGFVSPKKVMRMVGSNQDDLNILIARKYLIPFPSGIVVITHHRINNLMRKDWYKPTIYQAEYKQLAWDDSGLYYIVNDSLTVRDNGRVNAIVPPTVTPQVHQPLTVYETVEVTHNVPLSSTLSETIESSQLSNQLTNKENNRELSPSEMEAEREKIRRRMTGLN